MMGAVSPHFPLPPKQQLFCGPRTIPGNNYFLLIPALLAIKGLRWKSIAHQRSRFLDEIESAIGLERHPVVHYGRELN